MKASDIIYGVSVDLNDQYEGAAYTRWTQSQLAAYYEEALLMAATAYPQLFYKTLVVQLEPGHGWQQACECTHIKRVLGESTEDGELISAMQEKKDANAYVWPGPFSAACSAKSTESKAFTGYSINATKDNSFRVFPPILPTETRYVMVTCYVEPDATDLELDVPAQLVAVIKQWMLYRALIVDSENNPNIVEVAKTHLQTFSGLLAQIKSQSEKEAREDERNSAVRTVQDSPSKQVSS